MHFAKLDDSPMFRKQIQSLEENAESLRERNLKFYKGCRKYTEGLGEAYDGDIAFASCLEMFGGGHNDPIGVAFGGPVMTKFTIALREIGTYKEVLRSQVEHFLNNKILQFVDVHIHDVKESRKRFDRTSLLYDQAREKYLSIRKGTRAEHVSVLEEELHIARSSFEQARFNLVTALSNVEAKKRFEFLEAVSGTMDAHLRYFKQGYDLLHQMEPYIHQVLTYAQQSRERSNCELASLTERMQEFKRQIDREIRWPSNGSFCSPNGDGIQAVGRSSHKMIEAVMQSASKGKVQTIRQGYLSKRSSNLRGDWKRRFFVLDSRGMLYYYRKQGSRQSGSGSQHSGRGHNSSEHGSGILGRWFSSHYHGGVHDEKSVARHTVNLLTSTIKVDTDQSDLRFCFRIISPSKNYTLQAESAMDQMDWIEKITGVIASLLSSQTSEQDLSASPNRNGSHYQIASESSSFGSSSDLDHLTIEDHSGERIFTGGYADRSIRSSQQMRFNAKHVKPITLLRKVHGNDICADCGSPDPDWASLNLGLLVCIECSGVHRNLGVHISKVRSLTLDVKVWEPSVINLFQSLGNAFVNSIWEESLSEKNAERPEDICTSSSVLDKKQQAIIGKPNDTDPISVKEKFIHAKYAEKVYINEQSDQHRSVADLLWDSVNKNDKKAVYHHIVTLAGDVNISYDQTSFATTLTLAKAMLLQEHPSVLLDRSSSCLSPSDKVLVINSLDDENCLEESLDGFSLLHLACHTADIGMIELLLQYGVDTNVTDVKGRTPLHHCILEGKSDFAKLLLTRGANLHATDNEGKTPLQYAINMQNITDEEVLHMLGDVD